MIVLNNKFRLTDRRIIVVPGLPFPFVPGRPALGLPLTSARQARAQLKADLDQGYICQSKLNGDRVCVAVTDDELLAQNRHMGWLSQPIRNYAAFASLKPGTCLDGELMPGGIFHPFECLAFEGTSLLQAPTTERVRVAKSVCQKIGVEWLFDTPLLAMVGRLRRNLPFCEGYVRKENGPYPIGHKVSAETDSWVKFKW